MHTSLARQWEPLTVRRHFLMMGHCMLLFMMAAAVLVSRSKASRVACCCQSHKQCGMSGHMHSLNPENQHSASVLVAARQLCFSTGKSYSVLLHCRDKGLYRTTNGSSRYNFDPDYGGKVSMPKGHQAGPPSVHDQAGRPRALFAEERSRCVCP